MRPKHWIKNLLVFVPLVAGHALLNLPLVGRAAIAFGAFSLTASAVYLVNDLLDLAADRRHPIKRKRPFASGDLPIVFGLAAAPVLFASGLGLASLLGRSSLAVLGVYLGLTFVYTFYLKRKLLVDVFALAALYTLRIIGGGAAPAFYVRSGCSPSPCFSF
jgi:4-hydroxybenzoate polyprenyltransferase